jgi:hypothetical protein
MATENDQELSEQEDNSQNEDEMEEKVMDPSMLSPETIRARIDNALETLGNLATAKRSRSEIMADLAR